jgi:hypothetical protein
MGTVIGREGDAVERVERWKEEYGKRKQARGTR